MPVDICDLESVSLSAVVTVIDRTTTGIVFMFFSKLSYTFFFVVDGKPELANMWTFLLELHGIPEGKKKSFRLA